MDDLLRETHDVAIRLEANLTNLLEKVDTLCDQVKKNTTRLTILETEHQERSSNCGMGYRKKHIIIGVAGGAGGASLVAAIIEAIVKYSGA